MGNQDKDQTKKDLELLEFLEESLNLINDGNDPSSINSWQYVRRLRSLMTLEESNPTLEGLNYSWEWISSSLYKLENREVICRDDDEKTAKDPLSAFLYYVDSGFYPPPEILYTITQAFNLYFIAGGKLSLEDMFFGEETKWVGNEAARKRRDIGYEHFQVYFQFTRRGEFNGSRKKRSLEKVAEEFFDSLFFIDADERPEIDSFLRGYSRWKKERFSESLDKK